MKRAPRQTKRERKLAAMTPAQRFAAERTRGTAYAERHIRKLTKAVRHG